MALFLIKNENFPKKEGRTPRASLFFTSRLRQNTAHGGAHHDGARAAVLLPLRPPGEGGRNGGGMRWAIRARSSRPAWPVCCFAAVPSAVEGRVDEVDILLAHAILRKPQPLAEAYKME